MPTLRVGDHPFPPAVLADGYDDPGRERKRRCCKRRQYKHDLVRAGRESAALSARISKGLNHCSSLNGPTTLGPRPQLHRRPHLAVHQQKKCDDDEQLMTSSAQRCPPNKSQDRPAVVGSMKLAVKLSDHAITPAAANSLRPRPAPRRSCPPSRRMTRAIGFVR